MITRPLPPIQSSPPSGGLLSVASPIPAGWEGGVGFTPICGEAGVWPACPSVDRDPKTDISSAKPDDVEFDSFMLYAPVHCGGEPRTDVITDLARTYLENHQSALLAKELVVSDTDVNNPSLDTAASDVTPTDSIGYAPVGLDHSIGLLLANARSCGDVILHAPVVATAYFIKLGARHDGSKYMLGNIPVSFDHYPALDGSDQRGSQVYVYLTGQVEYGLGSEVTIHHYENLQNHSQVIAERLAILRFDTCCAPAAILVDLEA